MTARPKKPVRVLIVDDSALVRKILAAGLSKDPGIKVVGQAADPYQARDLLIELEPDVMTLDVEMPRMDGVTFLKKFMAVRPTPAVIISSLTQAGKRVTLEALESGAVDVIAKPSANVVSGLPVMLEDICERVKAAASAEVSHFAAGAASCPGERACRLEESAGRVIAIGASTGGVNALGRIMPAFPAGAPGIVIVQHMPGGFTGTFAERLNSISKIQVREAAHGDRVVPGRALVAPGGTRHMSIIRSGGGYVVQLEEGNEVNFSRPSVDVLFHSVAAEAGGKASAALLTGMGRDGASGLLAIRLAGGRTVAQDKETSIVFGMPGAAVQMGAAGIVAPLKEIPGLLLGCSTNFSRRSA